MKYVLFWSVLALAFIGLSTIAEWVGKVWKEINDTPDE